MKDILDVVAALKSIDDYAREGPVRELDDDTRELLDEHGMCPICGSDKPPRATCWSCYESHWE